jgi:hypothetical protein
MPPKKKSNPISRYLAKIGAKGGRTTGPTKARDPEQSRLNQLKGVETKRRLKAAEREAAAAAQATEQPQQPPPAAEAAD